MYVGVTFTGNGPYRSEVPAVSSRSLDGTSLFEVNLSSSLCFFVWHSGPKRVLSFVFGMVVGGQKYCGRRRRDKCGILRGRLKRGGKGTSRTRFFSLSLLSFCLLSVLTTAHYATNNGGGVQSCACTAFIGVQSACTEEGGDAL